MTMRNFMSADAVMDEIEYMKNSGRLEEPVPTRRDVMFVLRYHQPSDAFMEAFDNERRLVIERAKQRRDTFKGHRAELTRGS